MAPFQTPTITELADRAVADVEAELQTGPSLRRSLVRALAKAIAGAAVASHDHIGWVSDQIMPDTADDEQLARWASIWGIGRKAGTLAGGLAGFGGTSGVVVPVGTMLQSAGLLYRTIEEGVLDGEGVAAIQAEALEPGADWNLAGGTPLNLLRAVPGVQTAASVGATGFVGGNDTEDDEGLRSRLLDRLQSPPRGGAADDYVAWAKEVAGVTRAWAIPNHQGVGTVGLTFVRDDDAEGGEIPDQTEVDEVQAYVDVKRPIGAQLVVFPPAVQAVNFELSVTPDSAALRVAIEASLADLLDRASEPGAEILISHVHEAISTTAGERDHTLIAPVANIQLGAGEIAKMGVVTW